MKRKQWIVAGSMLIIIAIILVGALIMKGKDGQKAGTAPGDRAAQKGQVSSMPGMDMGSQTTQEKPSETPQQEAPMVEIPDDAQKLIGVKTVPAQMVEMNRTLRLTGRIDYDEKLLFTVNAKVEGYIERLYVDYTGMSVKKGDPLMEIYSPELLAAQQELISLSAWKTPEGASGVTGMLDADSEKLKSAARQRLRLWDISDAQIDRIVKAGKPERTLTIASPASGYVVKRYATRGMRVMAGEPLFDIADLSRVWVVSQVSESDMALAKPGMEARITVTGLSGMVMKARIDYVYPVINEQTRTLEVRSTLPNPLETLKPQMFATVEILADLGKRLAVPEDAVMDTGERQIVYVDRGEGMFEPRQVTSGVRAGGRREIVSGLKAGEKVAASALFLIDSEAQLKGVAPAAN
jgi:membrane fusion protein, copper/silver efflux system